MSLFYRGDSVAVYYVALGRNPVGHKERQGDGRTPEGVYRIAARNPASKYHLSLRVSYPSATDRVRAAQRGVSTGGDIMIHGLPPAFSRYGARHRAWDWTEGCIAVTDQEIEEIYEAVQLGAVINIKP
jgi:murein L,D-transpeptidase YafK